MSLTGRKTLLKAPKHGGVALKHKDSQGDCSGVCMCKNSSFLIMFASVTEFSGHRGVSSLKCCGVPESAIKHHSTSECQTYSQGFEILCYRQFNQDCSS